MIHTRRRFLSRMSAACAAATCGFVPFTRSQAADSTEKSAGPQIGVCDWSIGRRQRLDALDLAAEIGFDGVQFSFGAPTDSFDLRREADRKSLLERSKTTGVAIASLAMGVLNGIPYSTDDRAERWVEECVDVTGGLDIPAASKQILLAFFGAGEINDNEEKLQSTIKRLQKVAPRAEKAGVTLAIESWLDADTHRRILDAVDSPAVKVYYDVANMTKMGYDIYAEIRQLGSAICQVHCKENGFLLGEGKVDFPRVRESLDAIDYTGWLIVESATKPGKSLEECYKHNIAYLRKTFS